VKNMGVWRRSFEAAIVYTISGRLQEKFDSLVDDAGTSGQALVKVEDAALDDFDRDFKQQEETHKRYDPKGLAAGMESGKTVRLEELRQLRTARELNA